MLCFRNEMEHNNPSQQYVEKECETITRTVKAKRETLTWAAGVKQDMKKNQCCQNPLKAMNVPFDQASERHLNTIYQKKIQSALFTGGKKSLQKRSLLSLNFLRIMRILCPAPQRSAFILSPKLPCSQFRLNLPSLFKWPIVGSTALRRFNSFLIVEVTPRFWPDMNTLVSVTPCAR